MYRFNRTEPLDAAVYEALSKDGGWIGPDKRRYTVKHFYNSDGSREGMKYHVRREGDVGPIKWASIEKIYRHAELVRQTSALVKEATEILGDPDLKWYVWELHHAR